MTSHGSTTWPNKSGDTPEPVERETKVEREKPGIVTSAVCVICRLVEPVLDPNHRSARYVGVVAVSAAARWFEEARPGMFLCQGLTVKSPPSRMLRKLEDELVAHGMHPLATRSATAEPVNGTLPIKPNPSAVKVPLRV